MPAAKKTTGPKTTDKLPDKKKGYGQGWGKTQRYDLETPSGALCEVKRPGVNGLIKAGILDSLDSLSAMVSQEVIPNAEGKPKIDAQAVLNNPQQFQDMLDMLDKITIHCVTQPKIQAVPYEQTPELMPQNVLGDDGEPTGETVLVPTGKMIDLVVDGKKVPLDEDAREDGFYIDQVELEDKTFIMNFVMGGQADVAAFREESALALAGIQSGEAAGQ